jgi:K+-sensing histidine kinase KdpD
MIRYDKINKKIDEAKREYEKLKAENDLLKQEAERLKEVLDSTLHEVRRFSGELGTHAESLSRLLEIQNITPDAVELTQTILHTTGMISARLGFTDLELNPKAVSRQATLWAGIYKKFEKARHVLGLKCRSRRVSIQFRGNSYLEIEALPAFELVPFVILDNAVKYSPSDKSVMVSFEESAAHSVRVTISSFGPFVEADEVSKIFEKGYRGKHAQAISGDGLGLYLTKFLCDYHDVNISATSCGATVTPNGLFGEFSITLIVTKG